VELIPTSRAEVQTLQTELRPVEKSLHTGIAEYHLGGAVYETMDGDKPDAETCKAAAPHFAKAAAEFKKSREIVRAAMTKAEKLAGNEAFMTRMDDLAKILDGLERNTTAMADSTGGGKMAAAESCYAAAADLAKLATRMQENAHAFRLKMAARNAPK